MKLLQVAAGAAAVMLGSALLVHSVGANPPDFTFPGQSGKLWNTTMDAYKGKRIVYVPVVTGLPLFDGWTHAIKTETEALGIELSVRDANWDNNAIVQSISAAINEKVDLIIAHNPDIGLLAKKLKEAEAAGIFVVQVNMASNYATDALVGGDYLRMGAEMAEDLVKTCGTSAGKSGKIGIVQGPQTAGASFDQYNGAMAVFEKNKSEITIVGDGSAGPFWAPDEAKKLVSSYITQNPDLCAVFGFWDVMDGGSAAAIKEAGKTGQIMLYTSGAGASDACDQIRSGDFTKYWNYNSAKQGQDIMNTVKVLLQAKAQGVQPGQLKLAIYSTYEVQTRDNLHTNSCFPIEMVAQK